MPPSSARIEIDIARRRLRLIEADGVEEFTVSTAANGAGELFGSECTPRGKHVIRAKIGAGQPENTVFIGRRPSGEIYTPELARKYPQRDWILTRILWLSGLEPGRNRLGNVDTMRRYIYIHGCPSDDRLGTAGSHGCIKMRNQDIIHLFERVSCKTQVSIHE